MCKGLTRFGVYDEDGRNLKVEECTCRGERRLYEQRHSSEKEEFTWETSDTVLEVESSRHLPVGTLVQVSLEVGCAVLMGVDLHHSCQSDEICQAVWMTDDLTVERAELC